MTKKNKKKIRRCSYGIILDRKDKDHIIGFNNAYCVALDYRLQEFSNKIGIPFKCKTGLYSDADHISDCLECVNLSVGYYNHHSDAEFTDIEELSRTIRFVDKILKEFEYKSLPAERMEKIDQHSYYGGYSGSYSNSWYRDSYYNDDKYWQTGKDDDFKYTTEYSRFGGTLKVDTDAIENRYHVSGDFSEEQFPFPFCRDNLDSYRCYQCDHYKDCEIAAIAEDQMWDDIQESEKKEYNECY